MRKPLYLSMAIALIMAATQAHAAVIYMLNQDGCTNTCGTGPFGQISLEQTTSTLVTVTVTLNPGEAFAGTGAGEALEFNVAGPVTLAGFTAGFATGPTPAKASTFGTFLESVTCTICQGGGNTDLSGPLSFTVTSTAGVTTADFTANSKGHYFAVDILGTNGNTGNVGDSVAAIGSRAFSVSGPSVPEPVSASLIGIGLIAFSLAARRRQMNR